MAYMDTMKADDKRLDEIDAEIDKINKQIEQLQYQRRMLDLEYRAICSPDKISWKHVAICPSNNLSLK